MQKTEITSDPAREERNKINSQNAKLLHTPEFIMFDPKLLKSGLSAYAILLYGFLKFYTHDGKEFISTDKQIGEVFNFSDTTAQKYIKELKDKGLLKSDYKKIPGQDLVRKLIVVIPPTPQKRGDPLPRIRETHSLELGSPTILEDNKEEDNIKKEEEKKESPAHSAPYENFLSFCRRWSLTTTTTEKKYLLLREEFLNRVNWWMEVEKCGTWLSGNGLRVVSIPRLRNWMLNAIRFQKDKEIKQRASFEDKKNPSAKKFIKIKQMPVWTPPV